jgi:hypothetical protein
VRKIASPLVILFLTALCALTAAQDAAFSEDGASQAISPDRSATAKRLFKGNDKIAVFVEVTCDDPALEAAIRVIAQDRLRSVEYVEIVESMNDASVLLSFTAFRSRAGNESRELVIYSFAYGPPDTEIVDGEVVSLPRYLYHEAVASRSDELATAIDENVRTVDADFIRLLR